MATPYQNDPYQILGITKDADISVVRREFRKLALKCHPDKFQDAAVKEVKQHEFSLVYQAYELLSDERLRAQYNEHIRLYELRKEMGGSGHSWRNEFEYEVRATEPRSSEAKSLYRGTEKPYAQPLSRVYENLRSSWYEDTVPTGKINRKMRARARAMRGQLPERNMKTPTTSEIISSQNKENKVAKTLLGSSRSPEHGDSAAFIPKTDATHAATARRDRGILMLEGFINGSPVSAIPDTGAEKSMMAASFAKRMGLEIQPEQPGKETNLQLASGKYICAVGVVRADWSLKGNPSKVWAWNFTILENCIRDIVIGDDFLKPNDIMSINRHFLSRKPRPRNALYVRNVNILGSPSQRLSGILNNNHVQALPDSGAEPNIISYAYAEKRGWLTMMEENSQHLLQFADGSLTTTMGQVKALWSFATHRNKLQPVDIHSVVFEILRDCPFDIVLGQDFLEDTDAFTEFKQFFCDVSSETGIVGLSLVSWVPSFLSKKSEAASTGILRITILHRAVADVDQMSRGRYLCKRGLKTPSMSLTTN